MSEIKISSVTILYNFDEKVIQNIKTYEKYVDEVILIDNSDSNDFYKRYRKEIDKYTYISMNGNKGIAAALNKGIRYSIKKQFNWCITFDQDSSLQYNIIDVYKYYINRLDNDNIIIYSPIYNIDRKNTKRFKGIKDLKIVMQSANLINLKLFESVGEYKEEFFIDVVDYEFCLRAKEKGYRIISCGEAEIQHNPGITKKTSLFNMKYGYCSKNRIYYQVRNLLWTYRKYKSFKILSILIFKLIKIIVFFDDKIEYLKYYKKGIKDCESNKFGAFSWE